VPLAASLGGARELIEAALSTAGLRVMVSSARVAPPCVFVLPGDTWAEPSQLGQRYRESEWSVIGIVGTADDAAVRELAETLADDVYAALGAAGLGFPTIEGPTAYDVGGVTYRAFRARSSLTIGG
jgi:hypothetical protein